MNKSIVAANLKSFIETIDEAEQDEASHDAAVRKNSRNSSGSGTTRSRHMRTNTFSETMTKLLPVTCEENSQERQDSAMRKSSYRTPPK